MAKTNRTPISKSLRFDVFKRDSFKCYYCGKTPPAVILEVDHIVPVSKGGLNDIENLITACFDCNRGKSNKSLVSTDNPLIQNADKIREKEEQLVEYQKIIKKRNRRLKSEIERVADIYQEYFPNYHLTDRFKNTSVKMFIEKLGVHKVEEAMHIACGKIHWCENKATNYFCGVCWQNIRIIYG